MPPLRAPRTRVQVEQRLYVFVGFLGAAQFLIVGFDRVFPERVTTPLWFVSAGARGTISILFKICQRIQAR